MDRLLYFINYRNFVNSSWNIVVVSNIWQLSEIEEVILGVLSLKKNARTELRKIV